MAAQVRLCKKCSGIKAKDLKGAVGKEDVRCGCFGACRKKHPELKGRVFGACRKKHPELKGRVYVRVRGGIVSAGSKKKLRRAVAEALAE